jgi:subfamily B ATP-binding cassette protein MsbA
MRFYDPSAGAIELDGRDLREYQSASFRSHVATVSQDVMLFNDTVAANIAYGRPDARTDEIVEAAKFANADGFIRGMSKGYDTLVGERGAALSGGQRQRIAIARAILKNPQLLILDEATSALDAESEGLVQDALDRLMVHRTSLVIAHRLSTVAKADRIVVLDEGRVVDVGPHAVLIKRCDLYRHLHDLQFRALQSA